MTNSSLERAAALAALALGQPAQGEGSAPAPQLERTGDEVYAGGDVPRLLIRPASTLGYPEAGVYVRAEAVPGDVILVTAKQAKRLDALGVTVDPATDDTALDDVIGSDVLTDEQLAALSATEAVAHAAQHPEDRARLLAAELAKRPTKQRASVIAACQETPTEDAEAAAEAAGQQDPAAVHGPTADEVTAEQQDNDAPGAGNN